MNKGQRRQRGSFPREAAVRRIPQKSGRFFTIRFFEVLSDMEDFFVDENIM